jgi:lysozyme
MVVRGIDVSNNNGGINWEQVRASGVEFGFAKVSEGTGFRDGFFPYNWQNMKTNGLVRGAYHFARPHANTWRAEADWFLSLLDAAGGLEPTDSVVLDMEDDQASGSVNNWTLNWLEYVHGKVGFPPLLYTGSYYLSEHSIDSPELSTYPLWLAAYQQGMPPCPLPWLTYLVWQYSGSGRVPGVNGDCDLDSVYALDDLKAAGKPGAVPNPNPKPTFAVGEGILNKMTAIGDTPASHELYDVLWSSARGASGLLYVYYKNTGEIGVYPPS